MRQVVLILVIAALFGLCAGCGGGSKSSTNPNAPASIVLSPASASLNQGDVTSITATVLDSSGAAASNPPTVTFSTDNAQVASVNSTNGSVCGGAWDSSFIVCATGQVGTATITATAGTLTAKATVYVHKKVDRVVITTPSAVCRSVGQTLQLTAAAFSNGVDITSTVGPFTWFSTASNIATVDSGGLLTAVGPGNVNVLAAISNVISPSTRFTTCGVRSIHLHVANSTDTTFTFSATALTQQLTADVVDTAGVTISPTLAWISNATSVVGVSSTGLMTSGATGTAGVVAECADTCNVGLPAVYSDVVTATVSGSNATTVYVAGTGATQLIPIDTGTNTAGTAVTLPSQPNSMVFAPSGGLIFLGSSGGLMTVDTTSNSVSQNTALPGKVLAVSGDSTRVLIASSNAVYVMQFGVSGSVDTLAISGATAAAFTPDSTHAYIIAGSTLYVSTTGTSSAVSIPLTAAANDVALSPSAAFAYVASALNSITARATCDRSDAGIFPTSASPKLLGTTPSGAKVLAVGSPGVDILTRTSLAQPGCPPPLQASVAGVNLGQGAFTPNKLVVSSDGAKAYIASNLGMILVLDVNGGVAGTPIALAGGASGLSAGITLDGTKLYIGGSDNNVHRIDTAAGTDAQQISVSFTPDLVGVKPK